MEFFRFVTMPISPERLQQALTIKTLPQRCASVDQVLEDHGETGEIYCLWGQFQVRREPINGGVRFSMPGCPNALAWTVTTNLPPDPQRVVIHAAINRTEHDPDFIESVELFMDDWVQGLLQWGGDDTAKS